MAITLGDVILYLAADDSRLNSTLKGVESSTLAKVNDISKKVALAFGAVAIGAAIGVGKFLASTIEPASNLNETISKTNIVFGTSATKILKWGKTAAQSLGMSENSALAAAGTYGNLFRAMNIGEEASANMSQGLVNLAGDLASFNNMDPTEVLDKLRAGLSGETEPLKSLGVNINEALLKEKAFELGLWDGVGALDASAKAQASYALIMEQTTLAQGDFARTSGGLANQQRILKAKFEDLKATIGTALLPVVTGLVSRFNEWISRPETIAFIEKITAKIGKVSDAIDWLLGRLSSGDSLFTLFEDGSSILGSFFERLGMGEEQAEGLAQKIITVKNAISGWINETLIPFVQQHGPEIKAAFTGIGAALVAAGIVSIVTSIGAAIAAIGAPVLALIAVAALLGAAWAGNWGGIRDKTAAVMAFIQGAIAGGMQFINDLVNGRLGLLSLIFMTAWMNIRLIFAAFQAAFNGDWHKFGELLRQAWNNAWNLIKLVFSTAMANIKTGVSTGVQAVKSFFTNTDWGAVGRNILEGIARGITAGLGILRDAAIDAAQAALEAAQGFLGIKSPSTKFAEEVGEPSAEGFGKGFAKRMGEMGTGAGQDSLGAFNELPAAGAGAGGGINFTYVDQRFISLSDEFEAERILRPIIQRMMRGAAVPA